MTRRGLAAAACAAILLALGGCATRSEQPVEQSAQSEFTRFVDRYFDRYFQFYPSAGTAAGLHEYDTKLEDLSANSVRNRSSEIRAFLYDVATIRKRKLAKDNDIDARILESALQAELLELDDIRSWRKSPLIYVMIPGNAVDQLMKRNFAPAPERLRRINSRVKAIEHLLTAMNDNVLDASPAIVELAARIAASSVTFFRDEVDKWARLAAGKDTHLYAEFRMNNRRAVAAFDVAAQHLKRDLLPHSNGSFAIGAENYRKKLRYEEMVDIPLDRLLQIGEANLERDYRAFVETAKRIDSGRPPAAVMKSISNEHPAEGKLIDFAKATLEDIRRFVIDKRIIAIPSQIRPSILATPPYARSGTFASMDTPGPFETQAKEAFYYITPVEKDWPESRKEQHLRLFNRPVMDVITIHEAFPGHYVQFLYAGQFPTKTRKLLYVGSNVEGWAHYTEQMMVEEGFGAGDPEIRLAQLSEALIRDCRYVAGIKMHTQNMTVDQATKLFVDRAFQEPSNAYEEARRGAYNPTYLYYTLGKLQIYKLREDYKKKKGSVYSLEGFHSDFVKQGGIPIKLVREILLPGDSGATL